MTEVILEAECVLVIQISPDRLGISSVVFGTLSWAGFALLWQPSNIISACYVSEEHGAEGNPQPLLNQSF